MQVNKSPFGYRITWYKVLKIWEKGKKTQIRYFKQLLLEKIISDKIGYRNFSDKKGDIFRDKDMEPWLTFILKILDKEKKLFILINKVLAENWIKV